MQCKGLWWHEISDISNITGMGKKKENNEIMLLVDTVNGYIRSEKKV